MIKLLSHQKKNNKSIGELTKTITTTFHEDCKYLNCLKPSFEPKATEHVKEMISMVMNLIKNKHAFHFRKQVCFLLNS